MKIKILMICLLAPLFAVSAFAHEGHDKTPGNLTAPHGGHIQGTSHLYLELVPQKDGVKIYILNHDLKAVPLTKIKLEGTMTLPKKSKGEAVVFTAAGDSFEAKINARGAHRYLLNISVTDEGKTEKVKFNVEPE
jgi:hypothetical protein